METYNVRKEDLIGELEGFPIEVVQRMVDCQMEQWGRSDVKDFQSHKIGGFAWGKTPEGLDFWIEVILNGKFYKFFERYPKENTGYVIKPFTIELAKKIQSGEVEGTIKTKSGQHVEIVSWNIDCNDYRILGIKRCGENGDSFDLYSEDGVTGIGITESGEDNLIIEIADKPTKPTKHEFHTFEEVLVTSGEDDFWHPALFLRILTNGDCPYRTISGGLYPYCIPYKGNKNLAFKKYKEGDGKR